MRNLKTTIGLLLVLAIAAPAAEQRQLSFDETVDRVVEREHKFVATMKTMQPLAETYIEDLRPGRDREAEPAGDSYFLGRVTLKNGIQDLPFETRHPGFLHRFSSPFSYRFLSQGFAQMVILDSNFQKSNYTFSFVRHEFLGEVRCIVLDVQPAKKAHPGSFTGRIWVEDRDYNIVRFNGTYSGSSSYKYYLHFDSWRFNLQGDVWLPSYVYIEESGTKAGAPLFHDLYFKAQTRLWAYDPDLSHTAEFTQIEIDSSVEDRSTLKDHGPVEAQRMWERMAEDNALEHLQKVGLLAPAGDVDKVLQTVANNVIIANKLEVDPDVRCRVLLTMPLESFTIGHTIIVSRGLLDVLPDESSLAMVLAHELGHIVLGHQVDTRFAFNDRFFFPDRETFRRLDFERNAADEQAADNRAMDLLANSPYKDKLASAALFLRALHDRSSILTNLIRPHLGNRMENANSTRMAALLSSAPEIQKTALDQIAALPIGSRIKLDPWNDEIGMMNNSSVALLSMREKMPFEVGPFFPSLTYNQGDRKLIAENPVSDTNAGHR